MAPTLSEDEIDDLVFLARTGEVEELKEELNTLSKREQTSISTLLPLVQDESKKTCLHMAAGNGHLDTVKWLVAQFDEDQGKKEYLDYANEFGNTSLHWASLGGHLATVQFLIAEGASSIIQNGQENIALDLANFNGQEEVAAVFLRQMEDLEKRNAEKGGLAKAVEQTSISEEGGEGTEADGNKEKERAAEETK